MFKYGRYSYCIHRRLLSGMLEDDEELGLDSARLEQAAGAKKGAKWIDLELRAVRFIAL